MARNDKIFGKDDCVSFSIKMRTFHCNLTSVLHTYLAAASFGPSGVIAYLEILLTLCVILAKLLNLQHRHIFSILRESYQSDC
jgi:hypothetical protein